MYNSLGRYCVRAVGLLAGGLSIACGGVDDGQEVFAPAVGAGERPRAFLRFPADTVQAPRDEAELPRNFPRLLSQTGAFRDTSRLLPEGGLIPYEIQAPLWSDGAVKRRWVAVPEQHGTPGADIVYIGISVRVPEVSTFAALKKERRATHSPESADG